MSHRISPPRLTACIALVLALTGLLVPIPLMALELLVGVVQAYIFFVLATVFIGAAVGGESNEVVGVAASPATPVE